MLALQERHALACEEGAECFLRHARILWRDVTPVATRGRRRASFGGRPREGAANEPCSYVARPQRVHWEGTGTRCLEWGVESDGLAGRGGLGARTRHKTSSAYVAVPPPWHAGDSWIAS